jgi:hypothetical protein
MGDIPSPGLGLVFGHPGGPRADHLLGHVCDVQARLVRQLDDANPQPEVPPRLLPTKKKAAAAGSTFTGDTA